MLMFVPFMSFFVLSAFLSLLLFLLLTDHPSIAALNPGIRLPTASILVGINADSNSCSRILGFACNRIWPEWTRLIGAATSTPVVSY
jgi:hypothetical protein